MLAVCEEFFFGLAPEIVCPTFRFAGRLPEPISALSNFLVG
jgi:hypothetical protein